MSARDVARANPIARGLRWDRFWEVAHEPRALHPGGFTRGAGPDSAPRRANRSFYCTKVSIPGCP
jgi:hypothetical protein